MAKRKRPPTAAAAAARSRPDGRRSFRQLLRRPRDRAGAPSTTTATVDGGHTEAEASLWSGPPSPGDAVGGMAEDAGPSSSPLEDLRRALALIEDERHLAANELYVAARHRLRATRGTCAGAPASPRPDSKSQEKQRHKHAPSPKKKRWWKPPPSADVGDGEDVTKVDEDEQARRLLREKKEEFQALENRVELFASAKGRLSLDDNWIHAQTLFGITTSYRREADGSLSIRIEGELHDVPLFEQLVVLREVDLYERWAPFMKSSRKLAQLDKLDVVGWMNAGVPLLGLTRDACYRAVGCDCLQEEGAVLLAAVGLHDTEDHGVRDALDDKDVREILGEETAGSEGAQTPHWSSTTDNPLADTAPGSFLSRDAVLATLAIPPVPKGRGKGRITIRSFAASLDVLSPTAARTKVVVNVDPNLPFIPQFLIDFCMKKMCGILLTKLQAAARKVVKDPVGNVHARRMREDVGFYRDWLMPKFCRHCKAWGWEMPVISAFNIEEGDRAAEGTGWTEDRNSNHHGEKRLATAGRGHPITIGRQQTGEVETVSSKSTIKSTSSRFSRLKDIFPRTESQEEKIAEARRMAARRIARPSFSESGVSRLQELRAAKQRVERQAADSGCGSGDDQSRTGSFSSSGLTATSMSEEELGGEVQRQLLVFGGSLMVLIILLFLRRHRLVLNLHFAARNGLDVLLVTLQALALQAFLSAVLLYSFDGFDFGQRKLMTHMDYGRRLFARKVKTFSCLTAMAATAISCGCALVEENVQKFQCLLADVDDFADIRAVFAVSWFEEISMPCFNLRQFSFISIVVPWFEEIILPRFNLRQFSFVSVAVSWGEKISLPHFNLRQFSFISVETGNTIKSAFATPAGIGRAIFRDARNASTWVAARLLPVPPVGLKSVTTSSSVMLKHALLRLSSTSRAACDIGARPRQQWGARALDISSLFMLRLGVFVVALVLMSWMLLPKPDKKKKCRVRGKQKRASNYEEGGSFA